MINILIIFGIILALPIAVCVAGAMLYCIGGLIFIILSIYVLFFDWIFKTHLYARLKPLEDFFLIGTHGCGPY